MKSSMVIFVSLLVAAIAIPLAQAQPPPPPQPPLQLVNITGTVFCSVNATANSTATAPVFPNAGVQLRCGMNVIANATTNASGVLSILLNPLGLLPLSGLMSTCNLVVITPLSNCDVTLSGITGSLFSDLKMVGISPEGIALIIPGGFRIL